MIKGLAAVEVTISHPRGGLRRALGAVVSIADVNKKFPSPSEVWLSARSPSFKTKAFVGLLGMHDGCVLLLMALTLSNE